MSDIHAVVAVYDSITFDPNVILQTSEPIEYRCTVCTFRGTLEQGVEHVVQHQFVVRTPTPKRK